MLSIDKSQIQDHPSDYKLFLTDTLSEDTLQIVPYIVLHKTNDVNGKDEIFSFSSEKQDSVRVIGFGDYVYTSPEAGVDLITHVAQYSMQLLEEQLGIIGITLESMVEIISTTAGFILPDETTSIENKNKIGIQFFVDCTHLEFLKEEITLKNIIWVTSEDLKAQLQIQQMVKNEHLKYQYEEWSVVSASRVSI